MADLLGDSAATELDEFGFDETSDLSIDDRPLSARLEAALFNSTSGVNWPGFAVNKDDKQLIEHWMALPQVMAIIPADVQFAWATRMELRNNREVYYLYLLKRKVQFLGKFLENINLSQDSYGAYVVNFTLSGDGAARFAQLIGANINKPLAIVLDDKVESAPFINSKIRSRGQITMGGNASVKEARNMEIVLEAGALPAPVSFLFGFMLTNQTV